MRKLAVALLLFAPLLAQTQSANPLGNTRFPAARALDWKTSPGARLPALKVTLSTGKELKLEIVPAQPTKVCAHVKRVDPSPATDPKMIVGPPKGFESNMPVVQAMPGCQ